MDVVVVVVVISWTLEPQEVVDVELTEYVGHT